MILIFKKIACMTIINISFFLLLQTIFLGFFFEPFLTPLRMYLFYMAFMKPAGWWLGFVLLLDVFWWSILGLMTITHGIFLATSLLLWRLFLAYIKGTELLIALMIWMFTLLSLLPVVQWTIQRFIATIIIAALVAWYLTRYGRQSRELYNS